MKRYIFIPENLLLIWVLAFKFVNTIIMANTGNDIHHIFIAPSPFLHGYDWMKVLILFVYLIHIGLRRAGKTQKAILHLYIWTTILTMALHAYLFSSGQYGIWQGKLLITIFIVIQLVFTTVGIYRLSSKR